jgi:iron complex outermembrane receptor protein
MVFKPEGEHGPRLSLDYSHTRRSGDPTERSGAYVLANEALFPDRVTRDPLTAEDRAKGYTGGVVTMIDARGLSVGRLNAESFDARLHWRMPLGSGILRVRGSATRQLHNRASGSSQETEERVSFVNGPLKWRANGGAEWTIGPMMLGANLQYFSGYRIASSGLLAEAFYNEGPQGTRSVKAQAYFDIYASRRFRTHWAGGDHETTPDFGVINFFDHAPPYQADPSLRGAQYSPYGDPRQRRFELTLNAAF